MHIHIKQIVGFLATILTTHGVNAQTGVSQPLSQADFDTIIQEFTIIGDFKMKPSTRPVSDKLFWRYPFVIEAPSFPILHKLDDPHAELPMVQGDGKAYAHLNQGRQFFLGGDTQAARATWLSARARYGTSYADHRRLDYMLGHVFLREAYEKKLELRVDWDHPELTMILDNSTTFFNWAYTIKQNLADPVVEQFAPKAFYNIAAIYYLKERFTGAFKAAQSGMDFLRASGRKEFRTQFRQILVEIYLRNRSYLSAVQELDTGIRQDPNPKTAGPMFARIGDIFFDLNNYELAEDFYSIAGRIDQLNNRYSPQHSILRGEALFWMGRFQDALKLLHFGLSAQSRKTYTELIHVPPASLNTLAWGSLRLADTHLALGQYEAAKLAYFRVQHGFPKSDAAILAGVRRACLELPFYQGNNVAHARELLNEAKSKIGQTGFDTRELAWACEVGSYAQRERSESMLLRVKQFAQKYPRSRFLQSFETPVLEVNRNRLAKALSESPYRGIAYYETHRELLFPSIPKRWQQRLFSAYIQVLEVEKASRFLSSLLSKNLNPGDALQIALLSSQTRSREKRHALMQDSGLTGQQLGNLEARALEVLQTRGLEVEWDESQRLAMQLLLDDPHSSKLHAPWMLKRLLKDEPSLPQLCRHVAPLMQRMQKTQPKLLAELNAQDIVQKALVDEFAGLLAEDQSCLLSLWELERFFVRDSSELARLYTERLAAQPDQLVARQVWSLAEQQARRGRTEEARELWQELVDKSDPEWSTTAMARLRLNPVRSEFEDLWNSSF